jgi:hypothetical protein
VYLLDTNVVSELRKPKPHQGVVEWIRRAPEESLFLSVVSIGEIQAGIEITREQDPQKADEIEAWLTDVAQTYNIVTADAPVFRRWAQLMHHRPDHHLEEALIAATALVRDLVVVTRNVPDFKPFGVRILDPFAKDSMSVK